MEPRSTFRAFLSSVTICEAHFDVVENATIPATQAPIGLGQLASWLRRWAGDLSAGAFYGVRLDGRQWDERAATNGLLRLHKVNSF